MRLTDKSVAALKTKAERYEVWEDGRTGFGVRVSPKGRKSWVWLYRFQGRPRRMTIGAYPATGLAAARVKLAKAQELLDKGIDPGAVLVEERRAEREAETVAELVDEFLARAASRKRSKAEIERVLRREVVPAWGRRKAKDIRRRDVIRLLDGIVDRGSPVAANRTLAWVRRLFNFAIERDIVEINPCHRVKPPAQEVGRERTLSDAEIKALWHGLDAARMSKPMRLALKLILVTGQRPGEVARIELGEIDEAKKTWTIPAAKTKNGVAHAVPLSEMALALIAEAKAAETERERSRERRGKPARRSRWLFPSPRTDGDPAMSVAALSHALRLNLEALGLGDLRPHDLRRTAATGMERLGIPPHIIGTVLNHSPKRLKGITSVYARHDYDREKRLALEHWAAALERIVEGRPATGAIIALKTA